LILGRDNEGRTVFRLAGIVYKLKVLQEILKWA